MRLSKTEREAIRARARALEAAIQHTARETPTPEFAGAVEQLRRVGVNHNPALRKGQTVDQAAFEAVLGKQGITLAVTNRDGWSFKMRRTDNGKIGRKKASALTPDFTADAVTEIFRQRAAGITSVPKQPVPGVELDPEEFDEIAMLLKRRMASKTPKTPARERFVRGHQRQPQREREYGD